MVLVKLVADRVPQARGSHLVWGNERGDSTCTLGMKRIVAGLDESSSDATPAVGGQNREPVHISSPAIPSGDESAHHEPLMLGYEQRVTSVLNELQDAIWVVRRAGSSTSRLLPQAENRVDVIAAHNANMHPSEAWRGHRQKISEQLRLGSWGPWLVRRSLYQPPRSTPEPA